MMSTLEQRLDELESIEAIKQLKSMYCHYCDDDHNGPAIAALFVEDGIWESDKFGRFDGREAISGYFEATKSRISFAAHLLMNPMVTITGPDTATGKWRLLMPFTYHASGKPEAYWLVTSYADTFRRVDGRWYFDELKVITEVFAPHLAGWVEHA
ncbi:MAG: nuclear transport factor 2 family protein [Rhizobium sp.]